MPLYMIRNDITKVQADAIVNPANRNLVQGSGTSRGIYQAAGEQLLTDACSRLRPCEVGQAVATDAFELDAKKIIHAVAPVWQGGSAGEEAILHDAYTNSMKLAMEQGCESIAFPLISSGNMGFPKDVAMRVAMSAISNFLMEQDMMVYLVLYDRNSVSVSQKILGAIDEYIDDNYVDENDESYDFISYSDGFPRVREELAEYRSRRFEADRADLLMDAAPVAHAVSPARASAPAIRPKSTLEQRIENLDETFSQMLLRMIDERGLKDSQVYKKANIDRRHFSKIRNNPDYAPTKRTVISLAIALELTLDETVDLLNRAGYAFSKSSKFDVIICFFLESRSYDIFEINEVLFYYNQSILGE